MQTWSLRGLRNAKQAHSHASPYTYTKDQQEHYKTKGYYYSALQIYGNRHTKTNCHKNARWKTTTNKKKKAKHDYFRIPPFVESPYKLSNRFIEDLQKIHDYITYFHIDITRTVKSKIS